MPLSPEYAAWRQANPEDPHPMPVKTVPAHHSNVDLARPEHIAGIFGDPAQKGNFIIGTTREQGHPVCIDLEKFVQRSSGVFGATGTGKSFLTRLVLAGLIHYNKASILVLDMHNEYGFDDVASDSKQPVIGLKTKFKSKVTRRRPRPRLHHPRAGPRFQPGGRHERHLHRRHRDPRARAEPQRDHAHHAQRPVRFLPPATGSPASSP